MQNSERYLIAVAAIAGEIAAAAAAIYYLDYKTFFF